jgi:chemotaxis protein histidine kinase CheA
VEQKHLDTFRTLAADRLMRMNLAWIQFERAGDPAPARTLSREAHTLKGEAGFMGFGAVAKLVHAIEDLVNGAARTAGTPEAAVGDRVLGALDLIARLTKLDAGDPDQESLTQAFLTGAPAPEPAPAEARPRTGARPVAMATARRILEQPETRDETPPQATREVRVTSDKLDRVRDVVGEILLLRTRLAGAVRELRAARSRAEELERAQVRANPRIQRPLRETTQLLSDIELRLRADDHQMDRLASELEATTRDLRMVPVQNLFEQYPRHVRALAGQLSKQVQLRYEGESTEVDRTVLSLIEEPLLHLVRNALDHGIEDPDARRRAGKDPVGGLALVAKTVGQMLEIVVSDDGAGLDHERIRARAVEMGLTPAGDAAALRPVELERLVFQGGFSTRAEAGSVSGRGLGLDIVRSRVEAVGGAVSVRTTPGVGTSFVLVVPIRVAITSLLLFRVGASRFALPAASVVALVDEAEHPVLDALGGPRLLWEGELVPLISVAEHTGERPSPPQGRERRPRLVIVQSGGELAALRDTRDHLEREAVLKTEGWVFEKVPLVRGVAPLEDGTLAPVLKIAALSAGARGRALDAEPRPADRRGRSVLVVDDSPVIRDLISEALRSHNLQVLEAGDGEEAWGRLQASPVDLVVTDVEMPRLDGLGLIRRVRAEMQGRPLPIVVVSMRGSDSDQQRAIEAGADAYLVKTDFSHKGLWAMIERFLE